MYFCIYLTKKYGLEGASIATSISYLLMFISSWYFSNMAFKMPWLQPSFLSRKPHND
jgi:Na+-driven multidrug efflux pump